MESEEGFRKDSSSDSCLNETLCIHLDCSATSGAQWHCHCGMKQSKGVNGVNQPAYFLLFVAGPQVFYLPTIGPQASTPPPTKKKLRNMRRMRSHICSTKGE